MQRHAQAAAAVEEAAAAIAADGWNTPGAPGKWTCAEIVEHLILAYEVLLRELGGGQGMALRTKRWQRLLLWFTLRPWLLAGKPFPKGARAPREVRPTARNEPQAETLRRFADAGKRFVAEMERANEERPRARLTHAYFGRQPLEEVMRFVAAHLRHHEAQLRGAIVTAPSAHPGA